MSFKHFMSDILLQNRVNLIENKIRYQEDSRPLYEITSLPTGVSSISGVRHS